MGTMLKHRGIRTSALALALIVGTSVSALAATFTFDFTTASDSVGSIGNTRNYTAPGLTLSVSAVSSANSSALAHAALGTYLNAGLGVCNANEFSACNGPVHQVDNVGGGQDFVVFRFSIPVDVTSVVIDPFGCGNNCTPDRDVRYFIGAPVLNDVTGMTPAQLVSIGGLTEFLDDNSASNSQLSVSIGGSTVARTLVFGAPSTDQDDWFKVRSLSVTYTPPGGAPDVPAPATLALFGAALAGLGIARRRRA